MVSVNPMTAIAAYKSAAMSIVNQQGIMATQQANMRIPPTLEPVHDVKGRPSGGDGYSGTIGANQPIVPEYPIQSASSPELSFATLVREGVQNTISANRYAEYMSMEGVAGRADVTEVVAAISNAETSLSTLVTVRDKVITAYQEILRMPI